MDNVIDLDRRRERKFDETLEFLQKYYSTEILGLMWQFAETVAQFQEPSDYKLLEMLDEQVSINVNHGMSDAEAIKVDCAAVYLLREIMRRKRYGIAS